MFERLLKLTQVHCRVLFRSNSGSVDRHVSSLGQLLHLRHSSTSTTTTTTTNDGLKESDEVVRAKAAAAGRDASSQTIFAKIISREIKADILYEDEQCLAFNDANPQAPVHFLVIPKKRISMLEKADKADGPILGKLLLVAKTLANERLKEGYRVVINNGVHGSQSVYHLHLHVLGGRQMTWPPG